MSLRDEAVELLQALIRLDTVNPPGNETAAAELLRDYLEPFGVECELYARVPERANLVARIRGRGDGPSLLLLSHTDTVLADPAEWSVDPWSGELRDGCVWGRGALDMKDQVAASAVAIASLAREGFEPAGDLIFAATADEEMGEGVDVRARVAVRGAPGRGALRLRRERGRRRPHRARRAGAVPLLRRPRSGARRSSCTSSGRSGHGSMPGDRRQRARQGGRLIERLGAFEPEPVLIPETAGFLEAVADSVPPVGRCAGACALDRPGRGRDGRAAARDDGRADDDLRLARSGT